MTDNEWPESVSERLQGYADANSVSIDDAQQKFVEFLSDKYAVDNWQDEDEDFLEEAAEGFVVKRRGGSTFNTENWVGLFVGVDGKARDKRQRVREAALSAYNQDADKAVAAGMVARCRKNEDSGTWFIGNDNTNEPITNDTPWFLIPGTSLALLQNAEWAKNKGDPIRAELWSRYYYFLGNSEADFGNAVKLWRFDSNDIEAAPPFYQSCRLKVIPNTSENQNPDFADILRLPRKWVNDIVLTDDFVEPDVRQQLSPEKFCVNPVVHESFVGLGDLLEHYQANLKEVPGLNAIGPIVIVKGKVTSLFKEGWDTEYDDTGKTYNIRITSWDLQRSFPSGLRSEVNIRVSGHLKENCNVFDYRDGDKWQPYAERSTILVCGRLGVQATDDGEIPQIRAFGVHAVPRFVVPAPEGGDTGLGQFDGGE